MERIIKQLRQLFFPQCDEGDAKAEGKRRGKMTLVHVMALNNVNKASIRPVAYGVMGLKKGSTGYGNTLFWAKYRPGSLFSLKNAQILCREAARTYRFDILFIDNAPWGDKVNVLCPRCNDYWAWQETLDSDLRQESGRLCSDCREELSLSNRVPLGRGQAK